MPGHKVRPESQQRRSSGIGCNLLRIVTKVGIFLSTDRQLRSPFPPGLRRGCRSPDCRKAVTKEGPRFAEDSETIAVVQSSS
jgi:hypothetical protein